MVERSTASEGFQLDHAACIALLATQQVGRLVIADAGPPQIALVNYVLTGEVIVLRSDGGAKPHPLGQAVVFEVDCVDDRTHSAWSVIVRGTATEADPSRWSDLSLEPRAPGPKELWFEVAIEAVTGRLLRGRPAPDDDRSGYL